MTAYESAAAKVKVATSTVRRWVLDYETYEYITNSKRGKNSKVESPIVNNPVFREQFRSHVREVSRIKGCEIFFPLSLKLTC